MRSGRSRSIGTGLAVVLGMLLLGVAPAFAAIGIGVAPGPINGGNPVSVGQTNVQALFSIKNASSAPENTGTLTLLNGVLPGGIRETLSCDDNSGTIPCPVASRDSVFSVVNLGNPGGAVGSKACLGQTFTITNDPVTGEIIFTPDSGGGSVILGPSGSSGSGPGLNDTCIISFLVNVVKEPLVDADPAAGKQTVQLGRVRATSSVTGLSASATGSGETTVNAGTATVTTQSSTNATNVTPGATVSDTATVAGGGVTPTGTVTFFLCGPADVTGSGCPTGGTQVGGVKTLDGNGQATSDSTAGTTTPGKYCWRAEYSGDANYTASTHTDATAECFSVQAGSTVTTQSSTNATNVTPGTLVSDTATVAGSGPTPTGTVTFFLCNPSQLTGGQCPSGGTQVGVVKTLV
ncbi:MAG TPA: Ig-like domain-containing protein, partial [Candidatus Methylomirabilis sp.]|nr:Ig-like domain-containing protein [Candidatus Methylomirabilis sp.]